MTTASKTCYRCHQSKPLPDFPTHPKMADGHLNLCRDCRKSADNAAYANRQGAKGKTVRPPTCSWLVALPLLAGSSHRKWRGTA